MNRDSLLFMETEYQLESVFNFSQYIFDSKKLITLVGELHGINFKCPNNSISFAEYCEKMIENDDTMIFIEVSYKNSNLSNISSDNIINTFKLLKTHNKDSRIINFDERSTFMGIENQYLLYNDIEFSKLNKNDINQKFISSFDSNKLDISHESHTGNSLEFLTKNRENIIKEFESINNFIKSKDLRIPAIKQKIHQRLKDAWKMVADFYILRKILEINKHNSFIILVGEAHRKYIQQLFDESALFFKLNEQDGNQTNCVRLFRTYYV